jgi:heme exporter protein B
VLRAAALVAGKDLRIETRSRVGLNQILPFAFVVLVLFAFALDPNRQALESATPGLYWVAVLFTAVLAVQRSFALEAADGGRDALRLSGLDPAGMFLGKAGAVAAQLLAVEVLLGFGVAILYSTSVPAGGAPLLAAAIVLATVGLAAAGTLYGALSAGLRVRETLLPLLLLPVVAPVLIASTRAFESGLGTGGASVSAGWPWVGLLAVFALAYTAAGLLAFGPLLEEA